MLTRILIAHLMMLSISEASLAASEMRGEVACVRFQGQDRFDNLFAASKSITTELFGESGQGNLTQIQASGTFIKSGTPAEYSESQDTSYERRASLGVTQTLGQLSSFGISTGYTSQTNNQSKNSLSRWYSVRVGQWWNKATLLTELEGLRNNSNQSARSYLDTDGRRVLTPDRVQGNRYSLNVTWLASPQAMVMGSIAKITSVNRPEANAASMEGRYFISSTLTGVHLKVGAYEDTSDVSLKTDYGRISAREWETQLHQHLNDRFILALIFRDHFEREKPRSIESKSVGRHSRMIQSRLRYRFVDGPVTDLVPELYFFVGQYQSYDSKVIINHVGVGGSYVL
jgi:hypothetical protein